METVRDAVSNRDFSDPHFNQAGFAPLNPMAQLAAKQLATEGVTAFPPAVLFGLFRLFEGLVLAGTGIIAYYIYLSAKVPDLAVIYTILSLVTAVVATMVFEAAGLYNSKVYTARRRWWPKLIAAWTAVIAFLIIVGFFAKLGAEFSRVWLVIWFLGGLAASLAERSLMAVFVRALTRSGRLARRAVIIGGGNTVRDLIAELEASSDSGIRICGIFDDRGDIRSPNQIFGYRKLGAVAELTSFARDADIDLLIVALPQTAEKRLVEILRPLGVLPVDIRLAANMSKLRFRPRAYSYIGKVPFLDIADKPLKDWGSVFKAIEDRTLAAISLIAALPVMLLVALAVKLESPGPVFFRQHRYGFNNELIEVFKFRSMYVEATDENAVKLVTRNDTRVTRVGRFIRRTSLDELPQLLNVLRGDLAMVGPRPHATSASAAQQPYGDVVDGYFTRHKVKPGITGWAQVCGWRGETDTEEKIVRRVECDLYYIENWSVLFDLYILAITPLALLNTDQAY